MQCPPTGWVHREIAQKLQIYLDRMHRAPHRSYSRLVRRATRDGSIHPKSAHWTIGPRLLS